MADLVLSVKRICKPTPILWCTELAKTPDQSINVCFQHRDSNGFAGGPVTIGRVVKKAP